MSNVCLKTDTNLEDVCSSMHFSFICSDKLSFNAGVGSMPHGPVPLGNKHIRMQLGHHDTLRDCMDLGVVHQDSI